MEHELRMITQIAEDVIIVSHPSVPLGQTRVIAKPGGSRIEERAYGCKVCDQSLDDILKHNLPCPGKPVSDMIDGVFDDLTEEQLDRWEAEDQGGS
jgi:hypothetical protein